MRRVLCLVAAVAALTSCATTPTRAREVEFVDDSGETSPAWVCIRNPEKQGALMCMDLERFLLQLSARGYKPGTTEL